MRTEFSTARAATGLSALALLSPIAGMAVEVALAWRYGIGSVTDAYRIGSVMVMMGQQLLVQQVLPHILVPVFARCSARGDTAEAWRAAQGVGNVFLLVSAVMGVGVFLWPRPAVWLLAEGLRGEARAQATLFIRWLGLAYVPLVITGHRDLTAVRQSDFLAAGRRAARSQSSCSRPSSRCSPADEPGRS